jgi:hypothetical protein
VTKDALALRTNKMQRFDTKRFEVFMIHNVYSCRGFLSIGRLLKQNRAAEHPLAYLTLSIPFAIHAQKLFHIQQIFLACNTVREKEHNSAHSPSILGLL